MSDLLQIAIFLQKNLEVWNKIATFAQNKCVAYDKTFTSDFICHSVFCDGSRLCRSH